VAFAPANPASTTFFLRRDGCGTTSDNPHLSVVSGTDAGDGCGLTLSSFAGPGGSVDQSAFVDYPSADGMPLALDASRNISGTIDLENFGLVSGTSAGAGQLTVDISMEARTSATPRSSRPRCAACPWDCHRRDSRRWSTWRTSVATPRTELRSTHGLSERVDTAAQSPTRGPTTPSSGDPMIRGVPLDDNHRITEEPRCRRWIT